MDRMVKADGEASKAQADANRAQKALRQLETDVDALRCASHQYTTGQEAEHCSAFPIY